jgi:hypothetical protein
MGACPAQVQTLQRRAVTPVPGDRAHEQQLVNSHLTVIDITVGQAEVALQVERGQGLAVQYGIPYSGSVSLQGAQNNIG